MSSLIRRTHLYPGSDTATGAGLGTVWPAVAVHLGSEAGWDAGTRADRLKLRAVQASFATRPRCQDDEPGALFALAGELVGVGETDAALDLLVTTAALMWMAGGGIADELRRAGMTVLAGLGPVDPADTRVHAVVAVLGLKPMTSHRGAESVPVRHPDVLGSAALTALASGDAFQAGVLLDASISDARRAGRTGLLAHLCALRSRAAISFGDWDAAADAAVEAGAAATDSCQPLWRAHAAAAAAAVHAVRGDTEMAWRLAAQAEVQAGTAVRDSADLARGVALLSDGLPAEARTVLAPLVHRVQLGGARWDAVVLLGYLAEAIAYERTGHGVGPGLVDEMLSPPRWPAVAPVVSTLLYIRALLAQESAEDFQSARRAAADCSPWLTARIDLAHGIWLRRHRRAIEARPVLQAAAHTFESLGAGTWAERARRELRVGAVVSTPQTKQLTARERQITLLVADGLTNREIGRRIYLSPRTVAAHLYRIFPKFGITSRAQLAALANELLGPESLDEDASDAA